jgi:hypothetical protein
MATIMTPSPPSVTKPAFDFISHARKAHEEHGYDFDSWFDYWFDNGWVIKTPDYFALAGHDLFRGDAWFIWWGHSINPDINMVAELHKRMPFYKPYIGWARTLKGRESIRYYSTDRIKRAIK